MNTNKTVARVSCSCNHEFQDKAYGRNVRVTNLTQKGTGSSDKAVVRCTVCSREHTINQTQLK